MGLEVSFEGVHSTAGSNVMRVNQLQCSLCLASADKYLNLPVASSRIRKVLENDPVLENCLHLLLMILEFGESKKTAKAQ